MQVFFFLIIFDRINLIFEQYLNYFVKILISYSVNWYLIDELENYLYVFYFYYRISTKNYKTQRIEECAWLYVCIG